MANALERYIEFYVSDIEGAKALLIVERHSDRSVSSVKLTGSEIENIYGCWKADYRLAPGQQ